MEESIGEANQEVEDMKPYTNDVYAATPSSGSGGGGEEEEDDDKGNDEQIKQMEAIYNYLQTPSEDNGKTVGEWVTETSTYVAVEEAEVLEPLIKTENMELDESAELLAAGDMTGESAETVQQEQEETGESLPTTFKIFVSNLPPGLLSSELMELFQQHGEVTECEIFAKNYAFVHMTSEEAGTKALEELNGLDLRGCRINVKRSVQTGNPLKTNTARGPKPNPEAKPKQEPDLVVGTYKIYIGNLMEDVTKEYVSKLLEPCGRTVEIEIYRNNAAFVHMETEEGGIKAIEQLNGQMLPDCENEKGLVVSESKNPEGPSIATIKLMVKNVSTNVSPEEMRNLFTPYGLVLKVVISTKMHPRSNGCRTAIVHLEQFGNIRSAIKELTGKEVGGTAIQVEAYFDKPKPPKSEKSKPKPAKFTPSHRPTPRPLLSQEDHYGWSPVGPPTRAQPSEWTPPSKMRLIPMPSEADLYKYPGRGRGRRLLRPGGHPPPPLMGQNPWEAHADPWQRGYDNYNNDQQYEEAVNDGFGGGYSNYEEEEDYNNEYDVYDWSQHTGGNEYAPPPSKMPRNNSWNNSRKPGNFSQQNGNYGRGGGRDGRGGRGRQSNNFSNNNFSNNNGNSNYSNNKNTKGLFPEMPSQEEFPRVPKSLMSMQVPKPVDQDWSSDLPIANFSEFSSGQDFTSDEQATSTMNAVPFDYTQMRKKKLFSADWQQNPNFERGNSMGQGKKSGKGRKGNPRRPGLGSAQQQKKTAHQTGNDEDQSSSTQPGDWQPVSASSTGADTSAAAASTSSNAYSPYYFQQNWSFSKGKQKQNKKPTAKQLKEAEEEQKRQYADYLKQKPWLYQAIPGTVKKVQK